MGFFENYDMYQKQLYVLGRKLDASDPKAMKAKGAVEPPKGARIDRAIGAIDFASYPGTGEDYIIYLESALEAWYGRFSQWTARSSKLLRSLF